MGKRAIDHTSLIEDSQQRRVAYCKRKKLILLQAIELAQLCQQEIVVVLHDPERKRFVSYKSDPKFDLAKAKATLDSALASNYRIEEYTKDDYDALKSGSWMTTNTKKKSDSPQGATDTWQNSVSSPVETSRRELFQITKRARKAEVKTQQPSRMESRRDSLESIDGGCRPTKLKRPKLPLFSDEKQQYNPEREEIKNPRPLPPLRQTPLKQPPLRQPQLPKISMDKPDSIPAMLPPLAMALDMHFTPPKEEGQASGKQFTPEREQQEDQAIPPNPFIFGQLGLVEDYKATSNMFHLSSASHFHLQTRETGDFDNQPYDNFSSNSS